MEQEKVKSTTEQLEEIDLPTLCRLASEASERRMYAPYEEQERMNGDINLILNIINRRVNGEASE